MSSVDYLAAWLTAQGVLTFFIFVYLLRRTERDCSCESKPQIKWRVTRSEKSGLPICSKLVPLDENTWIDVDTSKCFQYFEHTQAWVPSPGPLFDEYMVAWNFRVMLANELAQSPAKQEGDK